MEGNILVSIKIAEAEEESILFPIKIAIGEHGGRISSQEMVSMFT